MLDVNVKYRIVGPYEGAKEYDSLSKAEKAIPGIYHDNLYKWQKQSPLTIWVDTYEDGRRFPKRDVVKTYSVEELARMVK